MKNIRLLLCYLLFLSIAPAEAQSKCFNFDDTIIGSLANKENAIDLFRGVGQPLEGWLSVSGSPSILANLSGLNYPSGQQCLLMAACGSNKAEGAAYNYSFQTSKRYKITFKYRYYSIQTTNAPLSTFDVLLTDGLVHNNEGGCGTSLVPTIPSGATTLLSETGFSDTTWQTASLIVSGLTQPHTQLWFRVNIPQPISAAPYLLMDNLCIEELASPICFNFDDSIIGTLQNRENAIDLFRGAGQPLEGWTSVNGSPSILSNIAGINYPSGSQCLLMAACGNNHSEGAAFNYNFLTGKNYKVSFKYRYYSTLSSNVALDSFDVILTNGLTHNNQGGCGTVNTLSVPSGSKNIFSKPNFNNTTWQTASFYVSGLTNAYSQIWWRVNINGNASAAPYLLMDDLCIEESFTNHINEPKTDNIFQIFPNPAGNVVNITFNQNTDISHTRIQLFDMLGKEINVEIGIVEDKIQIQTSSLCNGNYIVRYTTSSGDAYSKHLSVLR